MSMRDKILEETKRVFKPEFLNRLDEIIVFHTLGKPDLMKIVDLEVNKVKRRLQLKEIEIELDDAAHEFVIEKGYDPTYGARPMRRAVERYLEDPLAEELAQGQRESGRSGPRDGGKRKARFQSRRTARQRRGERSVTRPSWLSGRASSTEDLKCRARSARRGRLEACVTPADAPRRKPSSNARS